MGKRMVNMAIQQLGLICIDQLEHSPDKNIKAFSKSSNM